jgi:uncharacterized membrane protein
MAFELLSQMEDIRHRKEKLVKNKQLTNPVIVLGGVSFLIGAAFLTLTGILISSQDQSSPSGTGGSDGYAICAGVFCLFSLIGFIMVMIGIVRTVKSSQEINTAENNYQILRTQIISLEKNESGYHADSIGSPS